MRKYLVLFALIFIQGCSSGGNEDISVDSGNTPIPTYIPTPQGLTVFWGGSLDELKKLSTDLTFDELEIRGSLSLIENTPLSIKANRINITETGNIRYSPERCSTVNSAPDISLISTGDVIINGDVDLSGKNGNKVEAVIVYPSPNCGSCTGGNGGDISIDADNIVISSKVRNTGGFGSILIFSSGLTSDCSDGLYGSMFLTASKQIILDNIDASVGVSSILAIGEFGMNLGSMHIHGALDFKVGSTGDIFGAIQYDSLNENIGGYSDSAIPALNVLTPVSGDNLDYSQYTISLTARDEEMGLSHVKVTGLNIGRKPYSTTSSSLTNTRYIYGNEFINGTATITAQAPDFSSGDTLIFEAFDNRGNVSEIIVSGLTATPNTEAEPNSSPETAQVLSIPYAIDGNAAKTDSGTSVLDVDGIYNLINGSEVLHDWYKVSGRLNQVSLHYDNTTSLNLYIVDQTGAKLLYEPRNTITNYIDLDGSEGDFYIVVQASTYSSSRTNYTLVIN